MATDPQQPDQQPGRDELDYQARRDDFGADCASGLLSEAQHARALGYAAALRDGDLERADYDRLVNGIYAAAATPAPRVPRPPTPGEIEAGRRTEQRWAAYEQQLQDAGYGPAQRDDFVAQYTAHAPDDDLLRTEAYLEWQYAVLPEAAAAGTIPAPPAPEPVLGDRAVEQASDEYLLDHPDHRGDVPGDWLTGRMRDIVAEERATIARFDADLGTAPEASEPEIDPDDDHDIDL
ncbi:MAG: hypothetical protein HOV68_23165, partial [Streptomycetaceae bacterium]|nr:hypothetical protein [Streptomycetaceae bacterium]